MLRWLILIQAVVYLLIAPVLRAQLELGYKPSFVVTFTALAALVVGAFVPPLRAANTRLAASNGIRFQPQSWLWFGWLTLALAYAAIVVQYGLFDRRQGSDVMAELYATFPLPVLGILRTYEILLIPVILLYAFGASSTPRWQRAIFVLTVIASLPFLGLADSRSKLVVLGMSFVAFIPAARFVSYLYSNWRLMAGGAVAAFVFVFVGVQRAMQYGSLTDYLFAEVYVRLDGLNLVTKLREASILSWWGSFDLTMAAPLLSKIPFLEAAQNAKLLGRTSTKQYFIQDLLQSRSFDDSNSMVLDPLYFGGLAGLFIAFFFTMRAARFFDRYVLENRLFLNRASTALAMAFATGIIVFENDWVGSFANMAVVAVLSFGFLLVCTRRDRPVTSSAGSL